MNCFYILSFLSSATHFEINRSENNLDDFLAFEPPWRNLFKHTVTLLDEPLECNWRTSCWGAICPKPHDCPGSSGWLTGHTFPSSLVTLCSPRTDKAGLSEVREGPTCLLGLLILSAWQTPERGREGGGKPWLGECLGVSKPVFFPATTVHTDTHTHTHTPASYQHLQSSVLTCHLSIGQLISEL